MLDIRLLGTPRIFLNGEKITVQRRKTRSLLFYLAMHPNGVDRDALAELFGGKDDEGTNRRNLRRYLNFVRNIDKENDFVENYHNTIRLKSALVKVDALKVLEVARQVNIEKGDFQNNGRIPIGLYKQVQEMVALLDGESFIDSTDLDGIALLNLWKIEEDMRLRKAQGVLLTFLAEVDSHSGYSDKAYFWAERALRVNDSEEAHYWILKSLQDMGRLDDAHSYYQELQEILGGAISTRLRALGEKISNMHEAHPLSVRPVWALRPSASIPFVGQEDLLQRMTVNYQRGIGTLLVGEAGAGKTRLVQEFYGALPPTTNLLLLPCYQDSENLPYQPWIDMLRHSFPKEFWQTTPARWTNPLTMLLPELHDYRDDLGARHGDVFSNVLVFEAFKNLLNYATQKNIGLLFVEDAQWMDRISFSLLKYLILQSTFRDWNIGLIVTSRLGIHSGVEDFELDMMRGEMNEIEVPPLGRDEIKHLAFYLLQDELPDEKIARLERMTGGNPFFLLEMLSFHNSQENVNIFDEVSVSPPGVKQLIAARLSSLSFRARKVLNYAAIQGYHFGLTVLEEALGLPMEEMASVIAELEGERLIHFVKEDGDLQYAFLHENLREEVIHSLSPADLRVMHARIAHVLAQKSLYQNEQAAILAEHYEAAREFEKAFFAWHTAAQHAYRVFSNKDAQIAYQRAEKLLNFIDLPDEEVYEFYVCWGVMLFYTNNPGTLESVMADLLAVGQERGSGLLIGTAMDGFSDVCMARNQFEEGLERVEEALSYLVMDSHIPAQMNAFIHQGVFRYMLADFPASLDSFKTVLTLGEGRTDPRSYHAVGHAHYQMAAILTGMGYPVKAIEHAKASFHFLRLSKVPHTSILPHSIMGLANYYFGHYREGQEHSLRSLVLSRQTDTWRMLGYSAAYAGMNETEIPELGLAWKHAHEAIKYGEKFGHTEITSMGYKVLGDIYSRLEAPEQAAEIYQRGIAVDKDGFMRLENAARLGVTLGLLGDPKADATLEEALTHANIAGLGTIEFNARALQLGLFVAREDYESFDANVEEIHDLMIERSHPKSFVWIDYLQSLRLFQQGELDKSLALLEKTLPILEEIHFFWIHFRACKLHLNLLKSLGRDPIQPRVKLAEMLAVIEAGLGDAPLQEEWQIFSERTKAL